MSFCAENFYVITYKLYVYHMKKKVYNDWGSLLDENVWSFCEKISFWYAVWGIM